jgi:hypothetical protein
VCRCFGSCHCSGRSRAVCTSHALLAVRQAVAHLEPILIPEITQLNGVRQTHVTYIVSRPGGIGETFSMRVSHFVALPLFLFVVPGCEESTPDSTHDAKTLRRPAATRHTEEASRRQDRSAQPPGRIEQEPEDKDAARRPEPVNRTPPANELDRKRFISTELRERGLAPAGEALGHWYLAFTGDTVTWDHSDVRERGRYKLERDRSIIGWVGAQGHVKGFYDQATDAVLWDGMWYERELSK